MRNKYVLPKSVDSVHGIGKGYSTLLELYTATICAHS